MDKIFEKLDMGNVSDGYHTFNELYRYRMLYNAAFFNELAKGDVKVCKSHKHYDGEECFGGGWFIVMAELPKYMEKPKRTGGGGRTGEARKDEVSLLPLGLHYPYRYSIVTMRTFPIGIRFTSRTKISYYTIIV